MMVPLALLLVNESTARLKSSAVGVWSPGRSGGGSRQA
jgi:hypothetical protein